MTTNFIICFSFTSDAFCPIKIHINMFTQIGYVIMLMILSPLISIVQSNPTTKRDGLIVDITYQDTLVSSEEMFCFNQHSDRFVFSASLESNGCQVKCTFWASSSSQYWKFYNSVDIVHYNVSDNLPCGGGKNYCRSGVCINKNNLPGQAMLTIVSGYFPDQDYFSETDTYIEVRVATKKPVDEYIDLGSTRVIEDDDSPVFETTFTSPVVNKSGHFYLIAKDRDSTPDDRICSFMINFNSCKENDVCTESDGRYSIKYKLKWISQEK